MLRSNSYTSLPLCTLTLLPVLSTMFSTSIVTRPSCHFGTPSSVASSFFSRSFTTTFDVDRRVVSRFVFNEKGVTGSAEAPGVCEGLGMSRRFM